MKHRFLVSVLLPLCVQAARAQTPNTGALADTTINTAAPVAYVYVSRLSHINGYAAWANGKLTPVPGSPFANTNVAKMSVTKSFLFGADAYHKLITSYSIHSNGSLSKVSSINPALYRPSGCLEQDDVGTQVDFTGITLYYLACTYGFNTSEYSSFHITSSGSLQFLGNSGGIISAATQGTPEVLTKMGGNPFAFDSYCDEEEDQGVIQIYKRQSNGNLIFYGEDRHMPEPAPGTAFCAGMSAADATNHLAVAIQRIDSQPHDAGYIYGPYFIASYTADLNGNLTTTSTYANMPHPTVASTRDVSAISISPDGKYVAVGASGFQVLHFDGSNPPTNFSAAFLTGQTIRKFGWDRASHLYVLAEIYSNGVFNDYLHVYTVTSSGVKEASGSPYYIEHGGNVIVRTLQ
jgi:hypothetical protein